MFQRGTALPLYYSAVRFSEDSAETSHRRRTRLAIHASVVSLTLFEVRSPPTRVENLVR